MKSRNKIAIIGGGFTGLVAAYKLSKAGFDVSIFEKAPCIGGLASGFNIHGNNLEKTYHHIFKTDKEIISLARELGVDKKLNWLDSSIGLFLKNKFYAFTTPFDLMKFSPLSFINRIRAGLVVLFLQRFENWQEFKEISAYEWMNRYAGNSVTKIIWEPLLRGKFYKYFDKISMAWLWARIHIRASSREKGFLREKLGYFIGGFNIIIYALEKYLTKNNVQIFLNSDIKEVLYDKLGIMIKTDNKTFRFAKLIATVPSPEFAKLIKNNKNLNKEYLDKLNAIKYLGMVSLVFSSTQHLGNFYWNSIHDLNFPFLIFVNHTKLVDRKHYQGKYIYYVGAYVPDDHDYFRINDHMIINEWFTYVKKLFPEFKEKNVLEKHLFKFKNAQHIVDLSYENKIPDFQTPLKNVYLANFSQIFPEDRGINLAVREGNRIASIVSC